MTKPHMLKRTSLLVGASTVLVGLSACAAAPAADPAEDEGGAPEVLTSFSVLEDMVEALAGDYVEVSSIAPRGAEVHEYDPTPADVAAAEGADLVIENGHGLEEWFDQFIAHSQAPVVTAGEAIDARPITRIPGHPDDAGAEEELPTDPHGWVSPRESVHYIDTIEAAVADLVPDHATEIADNAQTYREELERIAEGAESRAEQMEQEVFIVSCEGAFSYLAQDLGFTEHYLWPLNAEDEGTARQVQTQIEFVDDHEVPVVFCESTVNDSVQRQVTAATGAELAETLYVDSLSEEQGPVPSHLEMLEHNIDTILTAHE